MRRITPEIISEAVPLIVRFRSGTQNDAVLREIFLRLRQLLPDPEILSYLVNRVPELTPEEVVEKAFEYRPIILGPAVDEPEKKKA